MKKLVLTLLLLPAFSFGMEELSDALNKKLDLKAEEEAPKEKFPQNYFTPDIGDTLAPRLKDVLITFIDSEQEELRGAYFRFTLYKAAQAIETAIKKRKVKATMVIDKGNMEEFFTPLRLVIDAGGKVYQQDKVRGSNGKYGLMHHKFMIFSKNSGNKKLLMNGSFNPTGQANLQNFENIYITDDAESIQKFEKEFDCTMKYSSPVLKHVSKKDTDPAIGFARNMNEIPTLK